MYASKVSARRNQQIAQAKSRSMRQGRETLMNNQRRQKLKNLLVQNYIKKHGGYINEEIIESEVSRFLKRDKLNEKDLKDLENAIELRLHQKQEQEQLRQNLTSGAKISTKQNQKEEAKNSNVGTVKLPDINNTNFDKLSSHSGMSGASDLSKFNEHGPGDKVNEQEAKDFKKIDFTKKPKRNVPKIDYSKYNDEWDAINMYNKKMFEEEKIINRIKDKEVQRRTKNDLDQQVKTKLIRQYQEKLRDKEFDEILVKHLKHMDELEEEKQKKLRARILKEKESRERQIKDEYIRKRIDLLKNKKYERELVKEIQSEIEREKQQAIEKKIAEREALQKTIKDNELRKHILEEEARKEREDDIKMMEDNAKIKEKQENDRIEYFKRIERSSNSFMGKAVETVLKEQERKNQEEDQKLKDYQQYRDEQADLEEQKRLKRIADNKKMIRAALDKQMEDKRKQLEYEKSIDRAQGRIWDQDTKMYLEHEKEVKQIIRTMAKNNLEALKSQIHDDEMRHKQKNHMSTAEMAMNADVLEKAVAM